MRMREGRKGGEPDCWQCSLVAKSAFNSCSPLCGKQANHLGNQLLSWIMSMDIFPGILMAQDVETNRLWHRATETFAGRCSTRTSCGSAAPGAGLCGTRQPQIQVTQGEMPGWWPCWRIESGTLLFVTLWIAYTSVPSGSRFIATLLAPYMWPGRGGGGQEGWAQGRVWTNWIVAVNI